MLNYREKYKTAAYNEGGFTQARVYIRSRFCGNLEVYRQPEPL